MRAQSISDSIKRLVFAINRIIVINFAIISNNVMQSLIKFIELSIDNNFDVHSYTLRYRHTNPNKHSHAHI